MAAKFIVAVCAQALLVQVALSQCAAGLAPFGLAGAALNGLTGGLAAPLAAPYGAGCGGVASSGGGFLVTSTSPLAPTGLSIVSQNAIEGTLNAGGNLPFLGTVSLEGVLPTAGAGAVSYGCGNGGVGIVSEGPIATGIIGGGPYAPAGPAAFVSGPAYGPGLGGPAITSIAGYGSSCGSIC